MVSIHSIFVESPFGSRHRLRCYRKRLYLPKRPPSSFDEMYCINILSILVLCTAVYQLTSGQEIEEDADSMIREIRKPISIAMPARQGRGVFSIARPQQRGIIPIARPVARSRWSPALLRARQRQGRSMPGFLNPNRVKMWRSTRSEDDDDDDYENDDFDADEIDNRMRRQINRHPVRFGWNSCFDNCRT